MVSILFIVGKAPASFLIAITAKCTLHVRLHQKLLIVQVPLEMEELRKKVQFFRDVKENKVDFGDNLSIGMVVEMR